MPPSKAPARNTFDKMRLRWSSGTSHIEGSAPIEAGEQTPSPALSPRASGTTNGTRRDVKQERHRKRKRAPNPEEVYDSDRGSGTKQKTYADKAGEDVRLLACPFFKRDPKHFSKSQVCVGPGWPTVYRLKEHLLRKHAPPPFQCSRCFDILVSFSELEAHQRRRKPCKVREKVNTPGKFTNEQMKELQRRTKGPSHHSEEDKWEEIYGILFPDEDVPSPYYDYDKTASIELGSFYEREFAPLVKSRLLEELGELGQSTVDGIIRICLSTHAEIQQRWSFSQKSLSLSTKSIAAKPRPVSSTDGELHANAIERQAGHDESYFLGPVEPIDHHAAVSFGRERLNSANFFSESSIELAQGLPQSQFHNDLYGDCSFDHFKEQYPPTAPPSSSYEDEIFPGMGLPDYRRAVSPDNGGGNPGMSDV